MWRRTRARLVAGAGGQQRRASHSPLSFGVLITIPGELTCGQQALGEEGRGGSRQRGRRGLACAGAGVLGHSCSSYTDLRARARWRSGRRGFVGLPMGLAGGSGWLVTDLKAALASSVARGASGDGSQLTRGRDRSGMVESGRERRCARASFHHRAFSATSMRSTKLVTRLTLDPEHACQVSAHRRRRVPRALPLRPEACPSLSAAHAWPGSLQLAAAPYRERRSWHGVGAPGSQQPSCYRDSRLVLPASSRPSTRFVPPHLDSPCRPGPRSARPLPYIRCAA